MNKTKGYIYILINISMPGLVKIGKTTKNPQERAKELSSATGVATPFELVYQRLFNNCHEAEKKVHMFLENKGFRLNNSREFFEMSTTDAINTILAIDDEEEIVDDFFCEKDGDEDNAENIGMIFFNKGMDYYLGENGYFQDFDKALENFQKSTEYGITEAYHIMGCIYLYKKKNTKMAITIFQKGAENRCIECYGCLGEIYNSDENYKNTKNADIAWSNFFTNYHLLPIKTAFNYIHGYLFHSLINDLPIDERWSQIIQQHKKEFIDYFDDINKKSESEWVSRAINRVLYYLKNNLEIK